MLFQLFLKPRKRVTFPANKEGAGEAIKLINLFNGKKDLYRSVYNFIDSPQGANALVDKVFFDFDPADGINPLSDLKKVVEYCVTNKISHASYFSGRGFHLYIYVEKNFAFDYLSPNMAIRNFVNKMIDRLGVNPDRQVIGDLMRVSRLPNTMNTKTKLFCIPITVEEVLNYELDDLKKLGKKQRSIDNLAPGNKIDLKNFDEQTGPKCTISYTPKGVNCVDFGDNIPHCVKSALANGEPGYQQRYLIITALRDLAYSKEEVEEILKKYLSEEKFYHCVEEEAQLDYLFDRQELLFPSCDTIQAQGYCIRECRGQSIYV